MNQEVKTPKTKKKPPAMVRDYVKGTTPKSPAAVKKKAAAKSKMKDMKPKYPEGQELPPEIEALDKNERPMIWRDLGLFTAQHGRTIADTVYDLVLLSSHAYATKAMLRTVVPFDLELLARFYDLNPSSCAWVRPDVRSTFELMYGDIIATFPADVQDVARLALGRRYAIMLGRVDTAQYRWLDSEGQITRRLGNILCKIVEVANQRKSPRVVFEKLAKKTWALRGFPIDKVFPSPTAESVRKEPGAPGRSMGPKKVIQPFTSPVYQGGAFS